MRRQRQAETDQHRFAQLWRLHRLDQQRADASRRRCLFGGLTREFSHHQHQRQLGMGSADALRHSAAVQVRQIPIQQHQVCTVARQVVQRGDAAADGGDLAGITLQLLLQHVTHGGVGGRHQHPLAGRGGWRWRGLLLALQRQFEMEAAAMIGTAVDGDLAAHGLYQLLRNRQAQPGAAVQAGGAGVCLREGAEQTLLLLGADANAGILHTEAQAHQPCRRVGIQHRSTHRLMCPRAVNFSALPTRLTSTWFRRSGSPTRRSGTSGLAQVSSSRPFSAARHENRSAICVSVSARSNGTVSSSSLPDSILAKSSTSSMMLSRFWPARPILVK